MGIRNTRNPNAMLGLEIGDRIKLKRMPDDPDPIPVNTLGTVTGFFEDPDCGQVWVDWGVVANPLVEHVDTRRHQ